MGHLVETRGRVLLPVDREGAAVQALVEAMAERDGWFDPEDDELPVSSMADLAPFAAASVERVEGWLVLTTDEEGDPKWSEQATAFYVELARWVRQGTVVISGEDGAEWSYTFAEGRLTQSGVNGWDGSVEPFGSPVEEQPPVETPHASTLVPPALSLVAGGRPVRSAPGTSGSHRTGTRPRRGRTPCSSRGR